MRNWLLKVISIPLMLTGAVNAADLTLPDAQLEGRLLAAELNAQRPVENLSSTGILEIRDDNGQRQKIPIRMKITATDDSWNSHYETAQTNGQTAESVTILYRDSEPTQYQYFKPSNPLTPQSTILTGEASAISFAGSDFWLCDLGLDFFRWPEQRLIRKEMRHSRSCRVLESVNPFKKGKYSRVLSWIDYETRGLVRAEAYDSQNKLLKEFKVGTISKNKVSGKWQLKELKISNVQTDSHTRLLFDLEIISQSAGGDNGTSSQ